MSFGFSGFGIGSFGGADFSVINHIPADNAIGVNRKPTISFTLSSINADVINSSILLTINGIPFIIDGIFTINATGSIDSSDPRNVHVTATTLNSFAPLAVISVVVYALNLANEFPDTGTTWAFTVNDTNITFTTYIMRRFQRVFRVAS